MRSKSKASTGTQLGARLGLVVAMSLALSACSPSFRNHGYIPPQEELETIVVGIDTRASVEETLGGSAAGSVVQDNALYYVRKRVRSIGFLEPKVVERVVVAISFDSAGVVSNVESFGLERGRVVSLNRRVTSSGVTNTAFLRQLLGNIGRIGPQGLNL